MRAWAIAISLALIGPSTAHAGPPEDSMEEVRRLFEEGRARYETLDYDGAIGLWTRAYASVPATEDNRELRNDLVYNIAAAQEKAFELDGDVTHLRQARGLLERYMDEYKRMYKPTPEARAEVEKVQARIAELDGKISQAGAGGPAAQPVQAPQASSTPPKQQNPQRERKIRMRQMLRDDPEIAPIYTSGKGMVTGGAVMLGIGGVLALIGLAFVANPDALDTLTSDQERRRRIGGFTAIGIGAGLVVGGAILLGLGVKRRKEAVDLAEQKTAVALTPIYDGDRVGLGFAMSF